MGHSDKKPISEENALSRMMRICSRKEYSTFDIRQKLYKLGQDAETIDKIIAKLIENKFIDNERYTRSFVSDKIRFSKWGEKKIRYTLSQKQIPTSIIDNVPLVASCIGMYDIAPATAGAEFANFMVDGQFWQLLAFCAGTGGSILIIGSAAGVAVMGLEDISFGWYLKKISWVALAGYLAGVIVYWLQVTYIF